MTNHQNTGLDFNPNEDYLAAVKAEQVGEGVGENAAQDVDPVFIAATLEAVATARGTDEPSPADAAAIADIEAGLGINQDMTNMNGEKPEEGVGEVIRSDVAEEGVATEVAGGVAMEVLSTPESIPAEAQEAIDYLKKKGFYTEQFAALKPGEVPNEEFAAQMISSLLGDPLTQNSAGLEQAQVLVENLPYDHGFVKQHITRKMLEGAAVTDRLEKMMEIVGVDPKEMHDEALKFLPRMLLLVAADPSRSVRTPKDVQVWRETFGITEDEYTDVLYNYWKANTNSISSEHLRELGFVQEVNGSGKWAWEK